MMNPIERIDATSSAFESDLTEATKAHEELTGSDKLGESSDQGESEAIWLT